MKIFKSLTLSLVLLGTTLVGVQPTSAATPLVVINEIQCAGTDWIELFNPGESSVNISGWLLTDKQIATGKNTFFFPANTRIAAKQFLTLYQGAASTNLSFGIGCTRGDTIRLASRVGMSFTLVDSMTTPSLPAGVGFGRVPDGTGNYGLTLITPNASNKTALPTLRSSKAITCVKLKVCTSQILVSSGTTIKLKSVFKGVTLNAAKKMTITARKAQKFKVVVTLTNEFGSTQNTIAITVK